MRPITTRIQKGNANFLYGDRGMARRLGFCSTQKIRARDCVQCRYLTGPTPAPVLCYLIPSPPFPSRCVGDKFPEVPWSRSYSWNHLTTEVKTRHGRGAGADISMLWPSSSTSMNSRASQHARGAGACRRDVTTVGHTSIYHDDLKKTSASRFTVEQKLQSLTTTEDQDFEDILQSYASSYMKNEGPVPHTQTEGRHSQDGDRAATVPLNLWQSQGQTRHGKARSVARSVT
jgi:hypothetical protein